MNYLYQPILGGRLATFEIRPGQFYINFPDKNACEMAQKTLECWGETFRIATRENTLEIFNPHALLIKTKDDDFWLNNQNKSASEFIKDIKNICFTSQPCQAPNQARLGYIHDSLIKSLNLMPIPIIAKSALRSPLLTLGHESEVILNKITNEIVEFNLLKKKVKLIALLPIESLILIQIIKKIISNSSIEVDVLAYFAAYYKILKNLNYVLDKDLEYLQKPRLVFQKVLGGEITVYENPNNFFLTFDNQKMMRAAGTVLDSLRQPFRINHRVFTLEIENPQSILIKSQPEEIWLNPTKKPGIEFISNLLNSCLLKTQTESSSLWHELDNTTLICNYRHHLKIQTIRDFIDSMPIPTVTKKALSQKVRLEYRTYQHLFFIESDFNQASTEIVNYHVFKNTIKIIAQASFQSDIWKVIAQFYIELSEYINDLKGLI